MPTATWPMPDQESSQVRRAQSARSYDGLGSPANPSAALRSGRARRASAHATAATIIHVKKIELTRSAADARARLLLIDRHCRRWEHSGWHQLRAREEENHDSPDRT